MTTHLEPLSARDRTLEPLLDIASAAAFLGVSRKQVYVLLRRGDLPATRVGSRIRFVPDELREYLERNRERGS